MPSKLTVRYNDYEGQRSTSQFQGTTLSAANFDAQNTAIVSLMDAIAAITTGLKVGFDFGSTNEIVAANAKASDPYARREAKWLVQYHEATGGETHTLEIPCPDNTMLDPNNRGKANIGDAGAVDAFVSAFEAFVKSDTGGNVIVDDIVYVGRNL